ncbi:UNVERIFIED_ORG: hypothetical protein BDU10_9585 [Burkholderia sp. CF145]
MRASATDFDDENAGARPGGFEREEVFLLPGQYLQYLLALVLRKTGQPDQAPCIAEDIRARTPGARRRLPAPRR